MKTSVPKILLLSAVMTGLLCTSVWAEVSEDPTAITLVRPVHFLAPDGSDVFVQPGIYRVESADPGLQLIPAEGNARLLGAEAGTHDEEVKAPLAVSLASEEEEFKDLHLVMLLLPGGQSLEAVGSYSGVRERGLPIKNIRKFKRTVQPKIAQATSQLRVGVGPAVKSIWPVGLVGLWMYDLAVHQVKKVQKSSGKWYWPGLYDLYPKLVHLTWGILPVHAGEIPKIISKQGYGFEVRLNGTLLQPEGPTAYSGDFRASHITDNSDYFGCPQGMTCLGTTIFNTKWASVTPPWIVEISYWKKIQKSVAGDKKPQKLKVSEVIYPNQTTSESYFEHLIYPIFQHDRCTSCHALGSKNALVQRHNGIISATIIQEVPGLLGMNLGCGGGCHKTHITEATQPVPGVVFHDSEWKTPRFDMGIDWRGKTAKYICQKVTSSLTSVEMLRAHFFHDARIAWAVHSGVMPPPNPGVLPKAPPGDYYKFKKLIDAWIKGDVPCPK